MNTNISLLVIAATSSIIFSCGNNDASKGKLTHDDAKKQIDEYYNQKPPDFFIHKFANMEHDKDDLDIDDADGIRALRDSSYILYVDTTVIHKDKEIETIKKKKVMKEIDTKRYYAEVKILDKGQPFFLREQKDSDVINGKRVDTYFKAGKLAAKIISVSDPATDANGNTSCTVIYKSLFVPNDMYKTFCLKGTRKRSIANEGMDTVQFTKAREAWTLKKP